jgi:16S rRNA (uracil1498-N3)-methyltransferase
VPAGVLAGPDRLVDLDGAAGHHAADVRRLRPGEPVLLTDGAGGLADAVVAGAGRGRLSCEVVARRSVPPPAPRLVVAWAFVKGRGLAEQAVAGMVEVGVDEIVPWQAARSSPGSGTAAGGRGPARWRAVAEAAAEQSRRVWWPVVAEPVGTGELLERVATAELAVVCHGRADRPVTTLAVPERGSVLVVVGPEGGLTDEELAALGAAGARPAHLGPTVLRASTAGTVAAALLLAATPRWSAARSG